MNQIRHHKAGSPSELLRHIVERPELVAAVRELEGEQLAQLIARVGLEDAGEIIALASIEQLERVFDEDLFRATTLGGDEEFQPQRFGLWLHVFAEAGDEFLAERLRALPRDLLILGIHRLVLVLDLDALAVDMSQLDEDEATYTEKALERGIYEEWEEFRLIARDAEYWDVLWAALLTLDRDHHTLVRHIVERCAALDAEYIEDNGGLYEVLTSDEMLENDLSADRADRRAASGYVAPADARAFLKLASRGERPLQRDPITRAYFRELAPLTSSKPVRESTSYAPSHALLALTQLIEVSKGAGNGTKRLAQGARSRGVREADSQAAALVPNASTQPRARLDVALGELSELSPARASERREEIAYLANVLMAGGAHQGRKPRPVEALELALEACDRGLARVLGERGTTREPAPGDEAAPKGLSEAARVLFETSADLLFRIGYRPAK